MHWNDPEAWDGEGGWRGDSGWGTHGHPGLIHVNVWQKPLQYCNVISLKSKQMNLEKRTQKKKKRKERTAHPGGLSLLLILNHIQ